MGNNFHSKIKLLTHQKVFAISEINPMGSNKIGNRRWNDYAGLSWKVDLKFTKLPKFLRRSFMKKYPYILNQQSGGLENYIS